MQSSYSLTETSSLYALGVPCFKGQQSLRRKSRLEHLVLGRSPRAFGWRQLLRYPQKSDKVKVSKSCLSTETTVSGAKNEVDVVSDMANQGVLSSKSHGAFSGMTCLSCRGDAISTTCSRSASTTHRSRGPLLYRADEGVVLETP